MTYNTILFSLIFLPALTPWPSSLLSSVLSFRGSPLVLTPVSTPFSYPKLDFPRFIFLFIKNYPLKVQLPPPNAHPLLISFLVSKESSYALLFCTLYALRCLDLCKTRYPQFCFSRDTLSTSPSGINNLSLFIIVFHLSFMPYIFCSFSYFILKFEPFSNQDNSLFPSFFFW